MKCTDCPEYNDCSRTADLRMKRHHCPLVKEEKIITNFDRIKAMSVDEMAALFYGIIHERDLQLQQKLAEQGIECSLIEMPTELHISYHKQWLERRCEK